MCKKETHDDGAPSSTSLAWFGGYVVLVSPQRRRLADKVYLVTGSTDGIGK